MADNYCKICSCIVLCMCLFQTWTFPKGCSSNMVHQSGKSVYASQFALMTYLYPYIIHKNTVKDSLMSLPELTVKWHLLDTVG